MTSTSKQLAVDVGIAALIVTVGIVMLTPGQLHMLTSWPGPGFATVLPRTAWTALKVWSFWAAGAAIVGAVVLRLDPRLGLVDAVIAGFVGVWVLAYLLGNLLGPIGLYRSGTLWAAIAIGAIWVWRRPPRVRLGAPSTGLYLTALSGVLMLPGLLIEQLGSPVPPYMDVLATPAAAQRIVTFGRYLPFDNDPYGYWNPSSQLPGLELFYALLALGGHSVAVMADTAAIVPMAGLLILGTYRLGKTLVDDATGGMATLFLSATVLLHILPHMHGRSVTFVLVAAGLAFVLDERRSPVRLVVGALALGTAVANHTIVGTLGMAVASFGLLAGGVASAMAGIGLVAGAALVALPTVHVGLRIPVPYPVMPLEQALGVALVVWSARRVRPRTARGPRWLRWLCWGGSLLAVSALCWHPYPFLASNHPMRFPLLVFGGGLGLLLMVASDRGQARMQLGTVTFALLLGIAIEYASNRWYTLFADPGVRVAMHNWFYKVDYWIPYILMLPTAFLAVRSSRVIPRHLWVAVVLGLLFIPWRHYVDGSPPVMNPNYHQHSLTESWAYQMDTGLRGHWHRTRDRHWAQSPAELEVSRLLLAEVAAGRITPATHVVHLSAFTKLYEDVLLFSVYTGINDDPYLTGHVFNPSDAGSRLRPIEEVHTRLAERPPYVVIHQGPAVELAANALDGYEELFNRDGIRLLRDGRARF